MIYLPILLPLPKASGNDTTPQINLLGNRLKKLALLEALRRLLDKFLDFLVHFRRTGGGGRSVDHVFGAKTNAATKGAAHGLST